LLLNGVEMFDTAYLRGYIYQ